MRSMQEAIAQLVSPARPSAWPRVRDAIATRNPAMPVLAVVAGVLYVVNLTVSGYANTYYALAAHGMGGSSEVAAWVSASCTSVSVSGSSTSGLYDCATTNP